MLKASKVAHVIGSPISHSLSPSIFSYISLIEKKKINYSSYEVNEESLENFMNKTKFQNNLLGFNVTLPLKEEILKYLSNISKEASSIGAVNVVQKIENELQGFNTDVMGVKITLLNKLHPKEKNCLIWGAGGAAKAVAFALGELEAKEVFVLNRSEKNKELTDKFSKIFPRTKFHPVRTVDEVKAPISVLINTTPLGMTGRDSGKTTFSEMNKLSIQKPALAFDLIYTPEHTDFMACADKMSVATVGGLEMLVEQALETWIIWMGSLSDRPYIKTKLMDYLRGILAIREDPGPLYLTGFMGVGKTTVGEKLSMLTNRSLKDSDQLTVELAEESIPSMFHNKGEEYFRKRESETIEKISHESNTIVSLGGGALLDQKNLALIKKTGKLIYLKAHPLVLEMRILGQENERPLLKNLSTEERYKTIEDMLNSRSTIYESATISVDTDKLTPEEVAAEIICKIGKYHE